MKLAAQNRRARYDYEILQTFEAGIRLTGPEVKACRDGHANLAGAYISFAAGVPVLKQATIALYKHSNLADYEPGKDRLLLLSKKQIETLKQAVNEQGISIVPLAIKAGKYIKIDIALAKGKKRFDKRETIKKRELSRSIREDGGVSY